MPSTVRAVVTRAAAAAVAVGLLVAALVWLPHADARTPAPAATPPVSADAPHHAAVVARAPSGPRQALVVGDSLTVGAEPWLSSSLRGQGWSLDGVDARVGRGVDEGLRILRDRAASLPATVVVALGTNDFWAEPAAVHGWLRTARAIVGQRRLVWVNLCLDDATAPRLAPFHRVNAALAQFAAGYGVHVADWCSFARRHGIVPGPDGIHYGPAAYRQRAAFYAAALAAGS